MKNSRKSFIALLLIAVSLMIIICCGIYAWGKYKKIQNTPAIIITSTINDELWTTGSTHIISWATKDISTSSKISITLRRVPPPPLQTEGQEFDPIVFTNLENNGTTSWTISNMYPTGTYIMGISSYDSIPVTNPILAESAPFEIINPSKLSDAQKNIETLGWKTYENTKGGYSFEYPKEWNATINKYNPENSLFGPGATSESGYGGVEFSGTLVLGQSLADFVKKFNSGVEGGATSETETTINGQNAIISILPKSSMEPTETESVSFEKNGKVFNMYLEYKTNFTLYPDDEKRLGIFNQMLSTFSLK